VLCILKLCLTKHKLNLLQQKYLSWNKFNVQILRY
jgi:hypothetical protein